MSPADAIAAELDRLRQAPATIVADAGPRIVTAMGAASITDRGNIGEFEGPLRGSQNIPIEAIPSGDSITVRAADWVAARAFAKMDPVDVVADSAARILGAT